MTQLPFKVLMVGCGNIAGGYDIGIEDLEFPGTHAGAYSLNKNFKIMACVEPDNNKRENFMNYWGISKGFNSLKEVLSSGLIFDIISICSPTEYHFEHVILSIKFAPKLIFCEKPVATSAEKTKSLIDKCNKAGILLVVNYNRRWDSEIIKLKQQLNERHYGKLRSIIGYYNKGILHNGSHMIDLLYYLLGDLQVVTVMQGGFDLTKDDPAVPVFLQCKNNIPIQLITNNTNDFSLFELQLIFSKGILHMYKRGEYWIYRQVINSNRFAGCTELDTGKIYPGGYQRTMVQAVNNIERTLKYGDKIYSDGTNAYQAQLICEEIIRISKMQLNKKQYCSEAG